MSVREQLHAIIDQIPEEHLAAWLHAIRHSESDLFRMLTTPCDDEEKTEAEQAAVAEAKAQYARGETLTTEQLRRQLRL
jgi:hypothetical protein